MLDAFEGGSLPYVDHWGAFVASLFGFLSHLSNQTKPNKAPEPTSTSVTLRAIVSSSELKLWTENRLVARSAPAVAVAHL